MQTGWTDSVAAALLGVHERTVGYRLAAIEKQLGRLHTQRRPEVAVALRLSDVLERVPAED